jgi:hypothetical protein
VDSTNMVTAVQDKGEWQEFDAKMGSNTIKYWDFTL